MPASPCSTATEASFLFCQARAGGVAETLRIMIVDHAHRLHEGVDDGGPAKFEAAGLQILGKREALRARGRDAGGRAQAVVDGTSVHEAPEIFGEAGV